MAQTELVPSSTPYLSPSRSKWQLHLSHCWAKTLVSSVASFFLSNSTSSMLGNPTGFAIKLQPEIWPLLLLIEDSIDFHLGYYILQLVSLFPPYRFLCSILHITVGMLSRNWDIWYHFFVQNSSMTSHVTQSKRQTLHDDLEEPYVMVPATSLIVIPLIVLRCHLRDTEVDVFFACISLWLTLNSFKNLLRFHFLVRSSQPAYLKLWILALYTPGFFYALLLFFNCPCYQIMFYFMWMPLE